MARILLLVTDLEIGGTPTVVRELALRLHREGLEVEVACLAHWGLVADQIQAGGVTVTALNAKGAWDLRVIWRLATLIRERRFDTVFSFLVHANAAAAICHLGARLSSAAKGGVRSTGFSLKKGGARASCFAGVRYIQSIQTTQPRPRWHWWLQRLIHRAAGKVVVPSPSVADVARTWAGVPHDRTLIIPNAVDLPVAPRRPSIPSGRPVPIGFIGRLDPIKRVPDLIEAAWRLRDKVHLHIFGTGPMHGDVERQIATLGASDLVTLHGAIERPADALAQIDLLILPSAAEGFGLVLIEAMAAGVPVIATNVPGIRDVVRDGQTGLLVPPRSPEKLADAIERVLDDAKLRQRLIIEGRKDVGERFSWQTVMCLYRELLA